MASMWVTADVDISTFALASDSNLAWLAKSCASFCHPGVNALDLWISLEEVRQWDVLLYEASTRKRV